MSRLYDRIVSIRQAFDKIVTRCFLCCSYYIFNEIYDVNLFLKSITAEKISAIGTQIHFILGMFTIDGEQIKKRIESHCQLSEDCKDTCLHNKPKRSSGQDLLPHSDISHLSRKSMTSFMLSRRALSQADGFFFSIVSMDCIFFFLSGVASRSRAII